MAIHANMLTSLDPPYYPAMGTYQLRALLCRPIKSDKQRALAATDVSNVRIKYCKGPELELTEDQGISGKSERL